MLQLAFVGIVLSLGSETVRPLKVFRADERTPPVVLVQVSLLVYRGGSGGWL